jgi:Reverse transcriptase (RNA-dependent DNA polymerase)
MEILREQMAFKRNCWNTEESRWQGECQNCVTRHERQESSTEELERRDHWPLPKKRDLKDSNRGAVDDWLRQQKAGFRARRSCCDLNFTLRQIIDEVTALNAPLLVNFIDFKKAFESIHRISGWNTLRCYGIPAKIIKVMLSFYKGIRCTVRADGEVGEWFQIITRVWKGCVLSLLIILQVIDWIMKTAAGIGTNGIGMDYERRLTDLDFVHNIALLDSTWAGMVNLISNVEAEAATVGLKINADKTIKIVKGVQSQLQEVQAGEI